VDQTAIDQLAWAENWQSEANEERERERGRECVTGERRKEGRERVEDSEARLD